jgi:hypothetical protein
MPSLAPITYKQVLNKNGALEAIELWQGNNHITLTFSVRGTHLNHYRWDEVKPIVDRLATEAKVAASQRVGDDVLEHYYKNNPKLNHATE